MAATRLVSAFIAQRKTWVLTGLVLIAYGAAINRAQAFMWAIAAILGATLLTALAWPSWLVKHLRVSRIGPSRAQEGETIEFQVVVNNQGWLPRFMVELVDHLPWRGGAGQVLGLVAHVPPRARQSFTVPLTCAQRGHYTLGPVGLASSFPLGIREARVVQPRSEHPLTVYPTLFNIVALPLRGAPSQIHRGGYLLPEGAGAAEFSGLREYRRGDSPRHIHWPTTARLNELMVREYEPLASACLTIALDQSAAANRGEGRESTFEYAVRIAASMARLACADRLPTRLSGQGLRALMIPPGSGDQHFQGILDELAVVACDGVTPYARFLGLLGPQCRRGETLVVFLAQDTQDWEQTVPALAALRARQIHLVAVVFDRATFAAEPKARHPDPNAQAAQLADLGAQAFLIRQGDDLARSFNP